MKELESYCGTIDKTIYAYVEDYHTRSAGLGPSPDLKPFAEKGLSLQA